MNTKFRWLYPLQRDNVKIFEVLLIKKGCHQEPPMWHREYASIHTDTKATKISFYSSSSFPRDGQSSFHLVFVVRPAIIAARVFAMVKVEIVTVFAPVLVVDTSAILGQDSRWSFGIDPRFRRVPPWGSCASSRSTGVGVPHDRMGSFQRTHFLPKRGLHSFMNAETVTRSKSHKRSGGVDR
ncbi:hypothetical protein DL93DRAFT_1987993 [Clavulina sp. PMI_390]|nr:hypothetical protein DL93DRAFT_1987993 [Clavulina sp. PMI_390]